MPLVTLVYVSVTEAPMSDAALSDILRVSRENNARRDITGMLLYREGFFIQALEGEADDVDALYARIKRDPRHQNVLLVYRSPIPERGFEDWSMGFNKIDDSRLPEIDGYTEYLTEPFEPEHFAHNPNRATQLLQTFKDQTYF